MIFSISANIKKEHTFLYIHAHVIVPHHIHPCYKDTTVHVYLQIYNVCMYIFI